MKRSDAEALVRLLEAAYGEQPEERRGLILNWLAANLEPQAARIIVDRYIDRSSAWPLPADLRSIADGETTQGVGSPVADAIHWLARTREIAVPEARRIVEQGLREARGEIPDPPSALATELGLPECTTEAERYERVLAHLAARPGTFADRVHVLVAGAYERHLGGPRQQEMATSKRGSAS